MPGGGGATGLVAAVVLVLVRRLENLVLTGGQSLVATECVRCRRARSALGSRRAVRTAGVLNPIVRSCWDDARWGGCGVLGGQAVTHREGRRVRSPAPDATRSRASTRRTSRWSRVASGRWSRAGMGRRPGHPRARCGDVARGASPRAPAPPPGHRTRAALRAAHWKRPSRLGLVR